MANRLQVNADLMGATRVQTQAQQRDSPRRWSSSKWVRASRGQTPSIAMRVRMRGWRPIGASIVPVARRRETLDERQVFALHQALAQRLLQTGVRELVAGDDDQAGGVAIEAVNDPGPLWLAARRQCR